MNQLVSLGDMYEMWEDGKSKKLCQTMSRALVGQVQDDWQELVNNRDDWDEDEQKKKFIRMLQNLGSRTFGPNAFKQQCKVMENGSIQIPETSLRVGTYRLIQINQMLPYLAIGAKSYNAKNLNKIILKSLSPKAMQKYVGDGGNDLDDINNILDLMSLIDSKLSLKLEVAALEQQQNKMKSGNQLSKDKGKSTNEESKGERKMPCQKHNGEHDWSDCPDNKNWRPQSKSKKEKEKSQKKDLHSTKGSE
jgi:hypothetical protein